MQLYKCAYVRITLLPFLPLIFTGTLQILITFDPVLIDAHFTLSLLLAVASVAATSSVSLFDFFLSILIPCSIEGCQNVYNYRLCIVFYQNNFLHYVSSKLLLGSHNKDVFSKWSYFYPQQFVPKLLFNLQHHADLHILGSLKFPLFCSLSP